MWGGNWWCGCPLWSLSGRHQLGVGTRLKPVTTSTGFKTTKSKVDSRYIQRDLMKWFWTHHIVTTEHVPEEDSETESTEKNLINESFIFNHVFLKSGVSLLWSWEWSDQLKLFISSLWLKITIIPEIIALNKDPQRNQSKWSLWSWESSTLTTFSKPSSTRSLHSYLLQSSCIKHTLISLMTETTSNYKSSIHSFLVSKRSSWHIFIHLTRNKFSTKAFAGVHVAEVICATKQRNRD